jgi:hypothetical protein
LFLMRFACNGDPNWKWWLIGGFTALSISAIIDFKSTLWFLGY